MAAKKPVIKIKPSKKGTFTAAAKKSGMSVQQKAAAAQFAQQLGAPAGAKPASKYVAKPSTSSPQKQQPQQQQQTTPAATSFAPPSAGAFTYEALKAGVPSGVDPTKKEAYLDAAEFQSVFGMSIDAFNATPKWKRDNKKKEVGLF